MTNLYAYWRNLSKDERVLFCEKSGISYSYMEQHLIHGRKKPSMGTIQSMIDASNNELTHKGLFDFFLGKDLSPIPA